MENQFTIEQWGELLLCAGLRMHLCQEIHEAHPTEPYFAEQLTNATACYQQVLDLRITIGG